MYFANFNLLSLLWLAEEFQSWAGAVSAIFYQLWRERRASWGKPRHITTVEVLLQKLNNFWKTGRLKLVVKNLIITEYQLFSRNMNFCIIYNLIINIEMK